MSLIIITPIESWRLQTCISYSKGTFDPIRPSISLYSFYYNNH